MTNSPKIALRMPDEIREAANAYCAQEGLNMSQLLLIATCREIGRPDLIESIRPSNRPKKNPGQRGDEKRSGEKRGG